MDNYLDNYTEKERTGNTCAKRRMVVWVLTAGFVLLAVLGYLRNCRAGLWMGEDFLCRRSKTLFSSRDDRFELSRDDAQITCEFLVDGVSRTATLEWTGDTDTPRAIVTFDDGKVEELLWDERRLTASGVQLHTDGSLLDYDEASAANTRIARVIMMIDQGVTQRNGEPVLYFLGMFIYVLGALVILFPLQLHKLGSIGREMLYEDASLTDFGENWVRFGSAVSGTVIIVISVLVVVRLLPPMQ